MIEVFAPGQRGLVRVLIVLVCVQRGYIHEIFSNITVQMALVQVQTPLVPV